MEDAKSMGQNETKHGQSSTVRTAIRNKTFVQDRWIVANQPMNKQTSVDSLDVVHLLVNVKKGSPIGLRRCAVVSEGGKQKRETKHPGQFDHTSLRNSREIHVDARDLTWRRASSENVADSWIPTTTRVRDCRGKKVGRTGERKKKVRRDGA